MDKMKTILFLMLLFVTFSCKNKQSKEVFEGFVLGKKINPKEIEKKFGKNSLARHSDKGIRLSAVAGVQ